ncbi:MAG: hypothetical protein ACJAS9_001937 [Polaribacter sp.]|jgi:hypothetical protein
MLATYLLIERKLERQPLSELPIRLLLIFVGVIGELFFRYFGLTNYASPDYFLPSWLFLIWLSFGLTFNGCYRWLENYSIWLAVLLGVIFGPLTYWLASRLAPFEILEPITFTVFSSLFWGVLFGISIKISKIRPHVLTRTISNK